MPDRSLDTVADRVTVTPPDPTGWIRRTRRPASYPQPVDNLEIPSLWITRREHPRGYRPPPAVAAELTLKRPRFRPARGCGARNVSRRYGSCFPHAVDNCRRRLLKMKVSQQSFSTTRRPNICTNIEHMYHCYTPYL